MARDPIAFDAFGCNVPVKNLATPDRLTPNIRFERQGPRELDIVMPDGKKVGFWTFRDKLAEDSKDVWPAAADPRAAGTDRALDSACAEKHAHHPPSRHELVDLQ